MSAFEVVVGFLVATSVVVGLRLALLYSWHRKGRKLPGESHANYTRHSPRFEDVTDEVDLDTEREYYLDHAEHVPRNIRVLEGDELVCTYTKDDVNRLLERRKA